MLQLFFNQIQPKLVKQAGILDDGTEPRPPALPAGRPWRPATTLLWASACRACSARGATARAALAAARGCCLAIPATASSRSAGAAAFGRLLAGAGTGCLQTSRRPQLPLLPAVTEAAAADDDDGLSSFSRLEW